MTKQFKGRLFSKKSTQIKTTTLCGKCGLHLKCNSPKIQVRGTGKVPLMFVIGHPDKNDDVAGYLMCGKEYNELQKFLNLHNINLDDCTIVSATACHIDYNIPDNKKLAKSARKYCLPHVTKAIKEYKPNVVIPLGYEAVDSLIKPKYSRGINDIEVIRGFNIPDQDWKVWLLPMYHPKELTRLLKKTVNENGEYEEPSKKQMNQYTTISNVVKRDLSLAVSLLDTPVPVFPDLKSVNHVLTEQQALIWLDNAKKEFEDIINRNEIIYLSWDIETTGLRCHNKGHKTYSISFCYKENESVAFRWTDKIKEACKPILEDEKIKKIGANIRYETVWFKDLEQIYIKGWIFDICIGAHILDSRSGIISLKFNTYVMMGIGDYEENIKKYLKAENNNAINKIFECPEHDMLFYNAIDSYVTRYVAMNMMKRMGILKDNLKYIG